MIRFVLALMVSVGFSGNVFAGKTDVMDVQVSVNDDRFTFSVTVKHADEGWDHYADKWEVVGEDGTVYGTRVLAHPHVNEQPFTRSGQIDIPQGIIEVIVRANDSVHGLGGREMRVKLPSRNPFQD